MRTAIVCTVVFVAIGLLALRLAAAGAPAAPKKFMTTIVMMEVKDGRQTIVAEPTVTTRDGEEGSFLAGGEALDAETMQTFPYGIQARINVRELTAGKLRLSMYASHGDLDAQGESSFVIREWSVHCIRTLAPGETIEIDLGPDRRVSVSIRPVAAKQ